jgi:phage-related minor tail protein
LNKVVEFFKKYWRLLLEITGAIVAFVVGITLLFSRKKISDKVDQLEKLRKEELERNSKILADERAQHDENVRRYTDAIRVAQEKYEEDLKSLEEKKKKTESVIVEKYKDDPDGLAKALAEKTGFVVIVPKDPK